MKIADVIKKGANKGSERQDGAIEAEKLKKQREGLEREFSKPVEVEKEVYREELPEEVVEVPAEVVEEPREMPMEEHPVENRRNLTKETYERGSLFKLTFVLVDGTKLCPIIECPEEMLNQILDAIDETIEKKGVVSIAEYKIPSERILYIDLKGRQ